MGSTVIVLRSNQTHNLGVSARGMTRRLFSPFKKSIIIPKRKHTVTRQLRTNTQNKTKQKNSELGTLMAMPDMAG